MDRDHDLAREAAQAYAGHRAVPLHAAVAQGTHGQATAIASDPREARSAAAAIAGAIVPVTGTGPADEAVFDALAPAARAAQALLRSGRIAAAAVTLNGRGRIIGPLDADLLLRHGVSRWR